eukprot:jgi/Ulvmu1/2608/UM014_0059.1
MEQLQIDLRSQKVCERCVQRLSGHTATAVAEALATVLVEHKTEELCPACLGILQYVPNNAVEGADLSAERRQLEASRPGTWAACASLDVIGQAACKQGHQVQEWILNVQAPGVLALSTAALWRRLQKHSSEAVHFKGTDVLYNSVTVKDVASAYIGSILHTDFQAKKGSNGVHICLAMTHRDEITRTAFLRPQGSKRPRGQAGKSVPWGGYSAVLDAALAADPTSMLQATQEDQPCRLWVKVFRPPVLVGGRYLKLQREVAQSPWILPGKPRQPGETSVQEELEAVLLPLLKADSGVFVTAGREDKDVRMLGTGRPFALQIINSKAPHPTQEQLRACEEQLAARTAGVRVQGLQLASQEEYELMKDGETEKQKHYRALCWAARELDEADEQVLNSTQGLVLQQDTPVRVLHRRAPLVRERVIHSMRCRRLQNRQWFVLEVVAQAGTYIKEFCHGDFGRTEPSVGGLLGNVEVQIAELDVMHIALDVFNSAK